MHTSIHLANYILTRFNRHSVSCLTSVWSRVTTSTFSFPCPLYLQRRSTPQWTVATTRREGTESLITTIVTVVTVVTHHCVGHVTRAVGTREGEGVLTARLTEPSPREAPDLSDAIIIELGPARAAHVTCQKCMRHVTKQTRCVVKPEILLSRSMSWTSGLRWQRLLSVAAHEQNNTVLWANFYFTTPTVIFE